MVTMPLWPEPHSNNLTALGYGWRGIMLMRPLERFTATLFEMMKVRINPSFPAEPP